MEKIFSKKKFIIFMMGYTGVGKSSLALQLAKELHADIFHSAITRKNLGLSPKKENVKKFFFLANPYRVEVDKKVYSTNIMYATNSLLDEKNVVLDAGYFRKWQREQVYDCASKLEADVYIVRVLFDNENKIRKILNIRNKKFGESPLNETFGWDTYIESKELIELPYNDTPLNKKSLNIIEYNRLTKEIKFIRGDKNSINSKVILNCLKKIINEKK